MKKRLLSVLLLTLMAVAVTSCKTDYAEEAANEARKYALENLKGLNNAQTHCIRYTQPILYSNLIFPRSVMPLSNVDHVKLVKPQSFPIAPQQDLMHHCFVWNPPGLDGSVVVIGEGERNLRFWYPYRVVVKNYLPADSNFKEAMRITAEYTKNEIGFLSVNELNRIRFSEPEVAYTRFDIMPPKRPDSLVEADRRLTPLEQYLQECAMEGNLAKELVFTQITLLWPADKKEDLIVVTGFSINGTLYGWKPQIVQYLEKKDVRAHILAPVDVKRIQKNFGPTHGKLVFPEEPRVNRGNKDNESGALFGSDLKF